MARKLTMFECEHCLKVLRKTQKSIDNHEAKCFSNVATRSCITCENYCDNYCGAIRENINDRRQSRKCEIGISLLERLQTNCADWKKIDHVENDFFIDGEDI